jgi:hypothetical protein
LGVRLLRHGADIGQAVSEACFWGRGGTCGRCCRVGARNSGQDAVVGRGGSTAEGQLGRLSVRGQAGADGSGSVQWSLCCAGGGGRGASEGCCRPTFRQCVDRAQTQGAQDIGTSEGMTYSRRRDKALHFSSTLNCARGGRNCVCLQVQKGEFLFHAHRRLRARIGSVWQSWVSSRRRGALACSIRTTTTRQLEPTHDTSCFYLA